MKPKTWGSSATSSQPVDYRINSHWTQTGRRHRRTAKVDDEEDFYEQSGSGTSHKQPASSEVNAQYKELPMVPKSTDFALIDNDASPRSRVEVSTRVFGVRGDAHTVGDEETEESEKSRLNTIEILAASDLGHIDRKAAGSQRQRTMQQTLQLPQSHLRKLELMQQTNLKLGVQVLSGNAFYQYRRWFTEFHRSHGGTFRYMDLPVQDMTLLIHRACCGPHDGNMETPAFVSAQDISKIIRTYQHSLPFIYALRRKCARLPLQGEEGGQLTQGVYLFPCFCHFPTSSLVIQEGIITEQADITAYNVCYAYNSEVWRSGASLNKYDVDTGKIEAVHRTQIREAAAPVTERRRSVIADAETMAETQESTEQIQPTLGTLDGEGWAACHPDLLGGVPWTKFCSLLPTMIGPMSNVINTIQVDSSYGCVFELQLAQEKANSNDQTGLQTCKVCSGVITRPFKAPKCCVTCSLNLESKTTADVVDFMQLETSLRNFVLYSTQTSKIYVALKSALARRLQAVTHVLSQTAQIRMQYPQTLEYIAVMLLETNLAQENAFSIQTCLQLALYVEPRYFKQHDTVLSIGDKAAWMCVLAGAVDIQEHPEVNQTVSAVPVLNSKKQQKHYETTQSVSLTGDNSEYINDYALMHSPTHHTPRKKSERNAQVRTLHNSWIRTLGDEYSAVQVHLKGADTAVNAYLRSQFRSAHLLYQQDLQALLQKEDGAVMEEEPIPSDALFDIQKGRSTQGIYELFSYSLRMHSDDAGALAYAKSRLVGSTSRSQSKVGPSSELLGASVLNREMPSPYSVVSMCPSVQQTLSSDSLDKISDHLSILRDQKVQFLHSHPLFKGLDSSVQIALEPYTRVRRCVEKSQLHCGITLAVQGHHACRQCTTDTAAFTVKQTVIPDFGWESRRCNAIVHNDCEMHASAGIHRCTQRYPYPQQHTGHEYTQCSFCMSSNENGNTEVDLEEEMRQHVYQHIPILTEKTCTSSELTLLPPSRLQTVLFEKGVYIEHSSHRHGVVGLEKLIQSMQPYVVNFMNSNMVQYQPLYSEITVPVQLDRVQRKRLAKGQWNHVHDLPALETVDLEKEVLFQSVTKLTKLAKKVVRAWRRRMAKGKQPVQLVELIRKEGKYEWKDEDDNFVDDDVDDDDDNYDDDDDDDHSINKSTFTLSNLPVTLHTMLPSHSYTTTTSTTNTTNTTSTSNTIHKESMLVYQCIYSLSTIQLPQHQHSSTDVPSWDALRSSFARNILASTGCSVQSSIYKPTDKPGALHESLVLHVSLHDLLCTVPLLHIIQQVYTIIKDEYSLETLRSAKEDDEHWQRYRTQVTDILQSQAAVSKKITPQLPAYKDIELYGGTDPLSIILSSQQVARRHFTDEHTKFSMLQAHNKLPTQNANYTLDSEVSKVVRRNQHTNTNDVSTYSGINTASRKAARLPPMSHDNTSRLINMGLQQIMYQGGPPNKTQRKTDKSKARK